MVADEGWWVLDELLGEWGGPGKGDKPKDMTPMAWKMPTLIVQSGKSNVPRNSAGTENPCVTTVPIMTNILNNANVLAFASCAKIIS